MDVSKQASLVAMRGWRGSRLRGCCTALLTPRLGPGYNMSSPPSAHLRPPLDELQRHPVIALLVVCEDHKAKGAAVEVADLARQGPERKASHRSWFCQGRPPVARQ